MEMTLQHRETGSGEDNLSESSSDEGGDTDGSIANVKKAVLGTFILVIRMLWAFIDY